MEKSILTDIYMDTIIWETLEKEIQNYENILILHGKKSLDAIKEEFLNVVKNKRYDLVHYQNECSYTIVENILKDITDKKYDLIIGVGGGKVIDSAKILMEKLNLPLFAVPTIASTCADVSALSVVYNDDHSYKEIYFLKRPPHKAFINLETIAKAPKKYLWAGIGDTMAKYYEMNLKAKGKKLNFNTVIGEKLSHLCKESMQKYGEHALNTDISDDEFKEVAGVILVTTGVVSNLIDFKYNGAIGHSIAGALTAIKRIEEEHLHGEVVAFGVLVQLKLEENVEEIEKMTEFYKKMGLPTELKEIVVKDEYLEKKEIIIDKILKETIGSEIPLDITREHFIKVFEGNL